MGNKQETAGTSLSFELFNKTISGDYVFTVYAVGSADESADGFVNGSKTTNTVTVTILSAPNSAEIKNNILTITNTNTKNLKNTE